jgi:hypothetical protein
MLLDIARDDFQLLAEHFKLVRNAANKWFNAGCG